MQCLSLWFWTCSCNLVDQNKGQAKNLVTRAKP